MNVRSSTLLRNKLFDSHVGFPVPLTFDNEGISRSWLFPKHSAHGIPQQPAEEVHVYLTTEIPQRSKPISMVGVYSGKPY